MKSEPLFVTYEKLNEIVFAGEGPSKRTIFRWIKNNGFPCHKMEGKIFFTVAEVAGFFRKRKIERFDPNIPKEARPYNPGCDYKTFVERLKAKREKELKK